MIWHFEEECQSSDSLYFLITFGICEERKYHFSTFLSTLLNIKYKRNTRKIFGERISTFCVLSYRHDNFYCAGMVIFTLRIIFFGVLRKCYKITVPHSNFYLEFPYSLWRTFFSVYKLQPSRVFFLHKGLKNKREIGYLANVFFLTILISKNLKVRF